jgi:hypothetical protein
VGTSFTSKEVISSFGFEIVLSTGEKLLLLPALAFPTELNKKIIRINNKNRIIKYIFYAIMFKHINISPCILQKIYFR